jgi:hypothetical protein
MKAFDQARIEIRSSECHFAGNALQQVAQHVLSRSFQRSVLGRHGGIKDRLSDADVLERNGTEHARASPMLTTLLHEDLSIFAVKGPPAHTKFGTDQSIGHWKPSGIHRPMHRIVEMEAQCACVAVGRSKLRESSARAAWRRVRPLTSCTYGRVDVMRSMYASDPIVAAAVEWMWTAFSTIWSVDFPKSQWTTFPR